jgi:hypothetical protein
MGQALMAAMRDKWGADTNLEGKAGEKDHLGNNGLDVRVIIKWFLNTMWIFCLYTSRSEYSSVIYYYIRGKRICLWVEEWLLVPKEPPFN